MTTPRYTVDDVIHLFTAEEQAADLDSCASLPFGVWDAHKGSYLSRHATREEAEAAIPTTPTVRS